ncbi:hypothetical protein [Planctomicrobium piriforme]|uniref:Holliday junction nuclease RuvC n=1 Tax=Planctomicrobium piriforme TaxID=1576369 RepID=A0A1I3EFN2_9PLAN|nr:hypothetical protein [Planctomicrobium piriforme]SFH97795.1 hypothetical protein SAMN05421753_104203 [Planctomicrobium piriforme]
MTHPLVMGIDPSLSNTAICSGRAHGKFQMRRFSAPAIGKDVRGRITRIERMIGEIDQHVASIKPDLILIEGYAMGAKFGREQLAELGGVLRWHIVDHCQYILEVPPSTLKKFTTSAGKGQKDMMIAHVTQQAGRIFDSNDEVDAWALFAMGLAAVGTVEMTNQKQREAVATVVKETQFHFGAATAAASTPMF